MEERSAAIASVVCFVIIVFLFFGSLTIVYMVYACCNHSDILPIKFALAMTQCIGALLYFYGSNINSFVNRHGKSIGCGSRCRENNRIAGIISIGTSLLLYKLFPPCLHKATLIFKHDHAYKDWYAATHMIVTIVKIDALYTVVATMSQSGDYCSREDLSISVSFYIVSVIIGELFMLAYCIFSIRQLRREEIKEYAWLAPLSFVIISISFPIHILTDNEQPLDCAFGCDSFVTNKTLSDFLNEMSCDRVGNSALRLGASLVIFVVISVLTTTLFSCRRHTTAEKVI